MSPDLVSSLPIGSQVRLEIVPTSELRTVDGRDVHAVTSGNDPIAGNRLRRDLTRVGELALAAGGGLHPTSLSTTTPTSDVTTLNLAQTWSGASTCSCGGESGSDDDDHGSCGGTEPMTASSASWPSSCAACAPAASSPESDDKNCCRSLTRLGCPRRGTSRLSRLRSRWGPRHPRPRCLDSSSPAGPAPVCAASRGACAARGEGWLPSRFSRPNFFLGGGIDIGHQIPPSKSYGLWCGYTPPPYSVHVSCP
jgi:hypothetical protein